MKTSETLTKFSEALAKAHFEIRHAMKDKQNPHLKNDYATLESVIDASKEALLKTGIIVIQSPSSESLTTRLQHTSGEFIESEMKFLLSKQDMQGLGSAITYARRYSLAALLNISQTDDDGARSSQPAHNYAPKQQDQRISQTDTGGDFVTVEALVTIQEKDLAKSAGFKWSGKKWLKLVSPKELEMNSYPFEIREVAA